MIRSRYARWMTDWEYRLETRDNNRVVRPFEWGLDWTADFPGAKPSPASFSPEEQKRYFFELNEHFIANSDEFFGYKTPTDFRLEQRPIRVHGTGSHANPEIDDAKYAGQFGTFLRFTSPVRSPYPENDLVNARWFPVPAPKNKPKRAMIIVPQWNGDALSHNAFARLFRLFGVSTLRLSMPYHDIRMPAELHRADYSVSANIGRTLHASRQGIVDIRCCVDWLEQQGYTQFGVLGTSLGSCYAFIASAHDPRIRVNIFNHASTYFGDVVWTGFSTRHVRQSLEKVLNVAEVRRVWDCISPMHFFDKFERWHKQVLMIHTAYDRTFIPEFSHQVAAEFRNRKPEAEIRCLPCGHYTLGEFPYKYMDAYLVTKYVAGAFNRAYPEGTPFEATQVEATS
ncbi:MAG: abhydrolase domain-containing 18 [Acidobacteria bacterium]|nr:MAG: abhydrolase domain-containing 18 [Acidobacteriota bacterium]